MNLNNILSEYDGMFGKYSLEEIEQFLLKKAEEAQTLGEYEILVTLFNEIIGFYRDTTKKEPALKYCAELNELLISLKLQGSIPYATSLLNIANAFRAFGIHKEAIVLFEKVEEIYQKHLKSNDFMYASLYNNWSLVYQETSDFKKAVEMLEKALSVVDSYPEAMIPQATTRTNLAVSLLGLQTEDAYIQAIDYLQQAIEIFEKDEETDFHYSAALAAMGDVFAYKKTYDQAGKYYHRSLQELEKHVGKNDNYQRILEKYNNAVQKSSENWEPNLKRSKAFYEAYGKPMIEKYFPEYADRIAVGLVGEGSDCFGFDDKISSDHDYESGFCMWLTEEDYDKIGDDLQNEYDKLTDSSGRLSYRRGVFSINQFYNSNLNTQYDFEKKALIELEKIPEHLLAVTTNGEIFIDNLGIFTRTRRQLLNYYPEDVWRKKIAQCIHEFSQYAQSNYPRMMARKDSVTAKICVGKAMESTLDLLYLFERTYAPYYKWKIKGIKDSRLGKQVVPYLEKISSLPDQTNVWEDYHYDASLIHTEDKIIAFFEKIAKIFLNEMIRLDLVSGTDNFLESYIPQILGGKNMYLIDQVILEEWKQFDKVQNEGGRADCQDDFETFRIMRKSQYLTWSKELLESYYEDLINAKKSGWNLIMEKYARMMKSTNPDKYAALEKDLPKIPEERIKIQEEIIKIQIAWMEDFAKIYPKLTRNMRNIHTAQDSAYNTSYETYLRGELYTYSEKTLLLYASFIIGLFKAGRNLAVETMGNTVKLYGYETLKEAEENAD